MKNEAAVEQTELNRDSSLELLRIAGMLMIVACHINHGGFNFSLDTITINRLWMQFLGMVGSLGNAIFVMLSGYFLVKSKGLNFHRLFNLWIRIFFYSVIFYVIFVSAGIQAFSLKVMPKILMPITKSQWWFASTYFVMYLIHPYINILLNGFTREDYKKYLAAIFLYWCIIPPLTKSDFQANNLINFICLYSLAGYIRLWADDFGNKNYIAGGILFVLINFMFVVVFDLTALRFHSLSWLINYMTGMMRPFTVLAVSCLLIGFKHLNIKYNKFINIIASAAFGVYLIHDNNFFRSFLWRTLLNVASFQESPYLIPYTLAIIPSIFIVCTVIELTRSKIFRLLSSGKLS